MSYRKEKKFKLTKYEFGKLKNYFLNRGMYVLHKTRKINSLYYDNALIDMFKDSEEGILPRKKLRIRWYNSFSTSSIETKYSSIEGRFKTTVPASYCSPQSFPKTIYDKEYGALTPSMFVSYNREYFQLKELRVTFDSFIKYRNYRYLIHNEYEEKECVMEIKVSLETSDDYIESIVPYPSSRFSKYSRGILMARAEL